MPDESGWPAAARKIRSGTFYMCFEEPDDPIIWTEIQNDGKAVDVEKLGFADLCLKRHPEMGCGVFTIKRKQA